MSTPRTKTAVRPGKQPAGVTGTGVEDVTRTARQVTRSGRDLITDVGEVLERELAMAVSISERLRDETVSKAMLAEARTLRVQSNVRDSAHRVVDLLADAVGVATLTVARFGERLADEPRRALSGREAAVTEAETDVSA
jgi:hypothetical protein